MNCTHNEKPTSSQGVTVVLDAQAKLGEGALWHSQDNKLYWIDIEGRQFHIYDPVKKEDKTIALAERIGTVVPVAGGGALVAVQNGIFKIDLTTEELQLIANPLPDSTIRFNDGKCDPSGRFWVGSMALDQRPNAATLYQIDGDNQVHVMIDSVTISNGIVWTSDKKTMYYNDTPTGVVQAFDYDDASGEISNRRVAVKIPEGMGSPDGMTIDNEDKLWIALWGGNCVARFDPVSGELLSKIEVPAPNVTSCAFGGPDLETLFITTARIGLSEEQQQQFPLSGNLFSAKPGVRGVPASSFISKPAQ